MLRYVMLCYVMLCYVMLCYVMLCYVMLCYVMLLLFCSQQAINFKYLGREISYEKGKGHKKFHIFLKTC
jgi:hypothetical protein